MNTGHAHCTHGATAPTSWELMNDLGFNCTPIVSTNQFFWGAIKRGK